jgi:hypothetical protein
MKRIEYIPIIEHKRATHTSMKLRRFIDKWSVVSKEVFKTYPQQYQFVNILQKDLDNDEESIRVASMIIRMGR